MYIPCLNGLRAVAIFLVLIAHLKRSPGLSTEFLDFLKITNTGTIGVRIFFVLSGFLITTLLLDEYKKQRKIDLKNFFIRRALRIFPCFYVYVFVLTVLSSAKIINVPNEALIMSLFYIQNLNVFQVEDLFSSSWLVIHSWSLSVEEQFYLLYPLSLPFLLKRNYMSPLVFFSITFVLGSFYRILNYSYPDISRYSGGSFFMHADFLLYGCGVAFYLPVIKQVLEPLISKKKYFLLISLFFLMLFAGRIEYYSFAHIFFSGAIILFSCTFILIFVLLFPKSILGVFLENKYVSYVGKLSYSIYVWQQLFLGSTSLWLIYKQITYFPFNIILIGCCALVSYYAVEKPFLRLKNRFSTHGYTNH